MTAVPRQPLMEARSDTHAMNALLNAVYLAVRIFERSDIRSWLFLARLSFSRLAGARSIKMRDTAFAYRRSERGAFRDAWESER